MKYTVQFLHNSTGYIPGTIPPKFSSEYVKPIPMCGSDGSYHADGRYSLSRVAREAREKCIAMHGRATGFQIVAYNPAYCPDRVIYGPVIL